MIFMRDDLYFVRVIFYFFAVWNSETISASGIFLRKKGLCNSVAESRIHEY